MFQFRTSILSNLGKGVIPALFGNEMRPALLILSIIAAAFATSCREEVADSTRENHQSAELETALPLMWNAKQKIELGASAVDFLELDPNPLALSVPYFFVGGGSWKPGSEFILVFDPPAEFANVDLSEDLDEILFDDLPANDELDRLAVTGISEYRDAVRVSTSTVDGLDAGKLGTFTDMLYERMAGVAPHSEDD